MKPTTTMIQTLRDKLDGVAQLSFAEACAALEAALSAQLRTGEIDRQKASDAAVKANNAYGQWMPERWLHLFLDAYEGKL